MGQAFDEGEHDEASALGFHLKQALVQQLALTCRYQSVERIEIRIRDVRQLGAERLPADAGDGVERTVADEAEQPGPRIAARWVVSGGIAPDLQHGVVHRIGRQRRLAGDAQRDAVERGRLQVIEAAERDSVCLSAARKQHGDLIRVGLVRRGVHHSSIIGAAGANGKHRRVTSCCQPSPVELTRRQDRAGHPLQAAMPPFGTGAACRPASANRNGN